MKPGLERRFLATEFETRVAGDKLTIEGYALKWNLPSQNLGGFREQVAEGATTKTIQEADIRGLINHDPNLILGRNRSGTMRLTEDSTGLLYEIQGDMRQSYVRDLAIAMERGDVNQSSFGFRAIEDSWGLDETDFPRRTLDQIALHDVSPVTYPAYLDSTSGLGTRALERFAEQRGLNPDSDLDLVALIKGIEQEPNGEPEEARAETTPLVIPDNSLAFELEIRARLMGLSGSR